DWTDRHDRYFLRLLSRHTLLYTEMVTTGAIVHGDRDRLLGFSPQEKPLALQLGGSDPEDLAQCARIARRRGYDEVNLNVGCPSDRVQKGRFGACLMLEPELVRDCLAAMIGAVDIPVTVKCRLGVDDHYSYAYFRDFISTVIESGCHVVVAHARQAVLAGLSPKQNREIPPLHHDWVHRLKSEFPRLKVIINGGIGAVEAAEAQLRHVDGVMLGRAAYQSPWILAECENRFASGAALPRIADILDQLEPYLQRLVETGEPVSRVTRHVLGLLQGRPGAKIWRRYLSQHAHLQKDNTRILHEALDAATRAVGDVRPPLDQVVSP
ncbi:MAG: tRNA dihydrouridine(20/20a) synthase DusA, partial [Gammaproteobacteria bacterium]|nr:tRNA dihydrouridine(20/20a) synthase DusA [Gammaproteobacteria bacterium]